LATTPAVARNDFEADLRIAKATEQQSVTRHRNNDRDSVWNKCWLPYVATLGVDPLLSNCTDRVQYLEVFAVRLRNGSIARDSKPIKSDSVRDAVLQVAKTFSVLGRPDPRLDMHGRIDHRLQNLYTAWRNRDPPPVRVKPIPLQLIMHAASLLVPGANVTADCVVDLSIIGFFYLLRPGKYCTSSTDINKPIQLQDIELLFGQQLYPHSQHL